MVIEEEGTFSNNSEGIAAREDDSAAHFFFILIQQDKREPWQLGVKASRYNKRRKDDWELIGKKLKEEISCREEVPE